MTFRSKRARLYFWASILGIIAWSVQIFVAGTEQNYFMGAVGIFGLMICGWCALQNYWMWQYGHPYI